MGKSKGCCMTAARVITLEEARGSDQDDDNEADHDDGNNVRNNSRAAAEQLLTRSSMNRIVAMLEIDNLLCPADYDRLRTYASEEAEWSSPSHGSFPGIVAPNLPSWYLE